MTTSDTLPAGWQPVRTDDGSWSLRHPGHGQACHSTSGAWSEAVERYVDAADLAGLAATRGAGAPVRLLDVGTGLGWNLAAAHVRVAASGGRLEALCLEREPGLLRAAPLVAERSGTGPWSPWYERTSARLAALAAGEPDPRPDPDLALELRLGDAREAAAALRAAGRRFDVVFLDAFSPAVEPDLWGAAFLADLAALLDEGGLLSTYTVSLTVRERLARAGLEVGTGPRVGPKAGGTLAARGRALPPLEPRAAAKLARRLTRPTSDPS